MINAKTTFVIASVIAILGVGAVGASTVFAASSGTGHQGMMSGLVNAIAQKFHLTPSDVQAVVDEQRQQAADQMKQKIEERSAATLAQAVKDGKLTQAQADAITAKQAEVKTFIASLQGKSPTDRQTALKTEMDSLKQWATDQKIPEQFILPFGGRGMGGWGRMGKMMNGKRAAFNR